MAIYALNLENFNQTCEQCDSKHSSYRWGVIFCYTKEVCKVSKSTPQKKNAIIYQELELPYKTEALGHDGHDGISWALGVDPGLFMLSAMNHDKSW